MNLKGILNNALVYDIETYAEDKNGKEIDINSQFDTYLELAQVKWVGIYSFRDNKEYYLEVSKDRDKIISLFEDHDVYIGFNSKSFDFPILVNNGLIRSDKWCKHIDCMTILGSSRFLDCDGYKYKNRGELMGYKFKKNSLECMAETTELEFQKSEIDYKIFKKNEYTEQEKKDIIFYLRNDIMATKGLFDKLFNFWKPFTELIDWKDVQNLSWIRSSIASLIYKAVCHQMGVEPTYGEKGNRKRQEMGGNVIEPIYEEAEDVWYIDFTSLYPNIFCMFNLFAEVDKDKKDAWHGNKLFKVKGYYDISHEHPLTKVVKKMLKQRIELKKKDPTNPMIYALKIFLNGLYGVVHSPIFEKAHTPNAGWDCPFLGQQLQKFVKQELELKGFEAIAGDTDALWLKCKQKRHNDIDYIETCLKIIIKKILDNVPFPTETFNMDIENYIEYVLFPFSDEPLVDEETRQKLNRKNNVDGYLKTEQDGKKVIIDEQTGEIIKKGRSWIKKRKSKKKNYLYLYKEDGEMKIKIVGLPIKKDGSTVLGMKIFNEVLKPKILENKRAKFDSDFIEEQTKTYLKKKEIMKLMAREFKVKPAKSYKSQSSIYAQISNGYFGGGDGVISLIKNNKIGNVGKGTLYCTVDDAIKNKLSVEDLDLEKLRSELEVFIKYEN